MHHLTQPITIYLESDPALVPTTHTLGGPAPFACYYRGDSFRLRLIPCTRGVRLVIAGKASDVHTSPESLAAQLGECVAGARALLAYAPEGTALHAYRTDRLRFYLHAIHAVRTNPKIARLWGLEA